MSLIAAVGLNPTSSLAVTIRRNRGYAVRSIDAMAPGPSVPPDSESGTNRGRSGRQTGLLRGGDELRVPAAERLAQLLVEHPGPDLKEQVGAPRRPAHLLLLQHPLAHHLVDGRLHEGV